MRAGAELRRVSRHVRQLSSVHERRAPVDANRNVLGWHAQTGGQLAAPLTVYPSTDITYRRARLRAWCVKGSV